VLGVVVALMADRLAFDVQLGSKKLCNFSFSKSSSSSSSSSSSKSADKEHGGGGEAQPEQSEGPARPCVSPSTVKQKPVVEPCVSPSSVKQELGAIADTCPPMAKLPSGGVEETLAPALPSQEQVEADKRQVEADKRKAWESNLGKGVIQEVTLAPALPSQQQVEADKRQVEADKRKAWASNLGKNLIQDVPYEYRVEAEPPPSLGLFDVVPELRDQVRAKRARKEALLRKRKRLAAAAAATNAINDGTSASPAKPLSRVASLFADSLARNAQRSSSSPGTQMVLARNVQQSSASPGTQMVLASNVQSSSPAPEAQVVPLTQPNTPPDISPDPADQTISTGVLSFEEFVSSSPQGVQNSQQIQAYSPSAPRSRYAARVPSNEFASPPAIAQADCMKPRRTATSRSGGLDVALQDFIYKLLAQNRCLWRELDSNERRMRRICLCDSLCRKAMHKYKEVVLAKSDSWGEFLRSQSARLRIKDWVSTKVTEMK